MSQPPPDAPTHRRWPRRLAQILATTLLLLGPWPVDDSSFEGSPGQARTLDRLDASPRRPVAGPIRVGAAEVNLTPTTPRPLAGFIGQVRTPFVGVDTPCLARALTVARGEDAVTILTADLLLIDARLAGAVAERSGVGLDRIYFTASHTHGGPGGWGNHPLEMLVAGAYDPAFFDELAGQLAGVVARSRERLEPAEMAFAQVQARQRQSNRVERGASTHDALSALIFRPPGATEGTPPLAILTVFGAHATVSHPVPPRLGADYPAALVAELRRRTGARSVLFAAGAVGDASPARIKAPTQAQSAERLGRALADDLGEALASARSRPEVAVEMIRLDVDLPPVRLPFFSRFLRFSPLATWWVADRRTHLQALRIGPAVLVGFPGDDSGHLADALVASTRGSGLTAVATSFNGDFRGYLTSARVFRDVPCYETRLMNFYGPGLGEGLNGLAARMVDRLSDHPVDATRPPRVDADLAPRIALAGLLAAAGVVAWPRRAGAFEVARRLGFATVLVAGSAALAFVVAPEAVDWAKVGLPGWARLLGLPVGCLGVVLARSGRPGRAALGLAVGCGLLSASWVVTPMILRGWARWGLSARSSPATSAS